jgi:nucleotide-binding universal stress UspA family protein
MYSKIIVPLDGSACAETALPPARGLARGLGVPLVLLQVVPYPQVEDAAIEGDWEKRDRAYLDAVAEDIRAGDEIDVEVKVLWGDVPQQIDDFMRSQGNAILAIATHGRTGFDKARFGSVTDAVLRDLNLSPVLLCRCTAGGS